jgi:ribosomal protein S17E
MDDREFILSEILSVIGNVTPEIDSIIKTKTVDIPDYKVEKFKEHIEKLNRKAVKYNITPVELTFVKEYEKHIINNLYATVHTFDMIVPKSTIMVEGWKVIGMVDVSSDVPIIHTFINDEEIPEKYKTTSIKCEHCNINRKRNKVFILKNIENGEYKSVGVSCVKDFTGHDILKNYIYLDAIMDVEEFLINDAEDADYYNFNINLLKISVNKLIAYSIYIIDTYGYISISDAEYKKTQSTKEIVLDTLKNTNINISNEYLNKANEIIHWFKDNYNTFEHNDYITNLNTIINSGYVNNRFAGYIISLYVFYKKQIEKMSKEEEDTNYEFYGNVGDKFSVNDITIKNIIMGESSFGYYCIFIITDKNNHIFIWNTNPSTASKNVGDNITSHIGESYKLLTGTIKEHKVYRGKNQTVITRCKLSI